MTEEEVTHVEQDAKEEEYFTNVLLFDKYDLTEIVINDGGLGRYIDLSPTSIPVSGG